LAKVLCGAARHAVQMVLDVRRGSGGRRFGRQLAFELLHRKLRRRPRLTSAGACGGRAQAATCDGDAWKKLTSSGGGARAVAAAAGLAVAARVGSKVKDRTGDRRGGVNGSR
jgi:hypothetical protein